MKGIMRVLTTNPFSSEPPRWALERIDAIKERSK